MTSLGGSNRSIHRQLRRILMALVFLTGLNAFLLWQTLNKLTLTNKDISRTQQLLTEVNELDQLFVEEDRAKSSESISPLGEIRTRIKSIFKTLSTLDKDKQQFMLSEIQKQWQRAKNHGDYGQLHVLTSQYATKHKQTLVPLSKSAEAATKATIMFLAIYVGLFAIGALIILQYFNGRVFFPIRILSEKMRDYYAGAYDSGEDKRFQNDEIGYLESQFHQMARRIHDTVDELKELDRVKTDFISIVSHELRTPMTSVKGSLSLILTGALSEVSVEVKEILTIAEKETDRLIRLINDILDLTKMEAKKLPLRKDWNPVNDIITSAVQGIGGLLEVTKVKVKTEYPELPFESHCDRDRIQQVITNLLSNAVKFSPAGSTVTVSYEEVAEGIVIRIADQGPGIKPEDQPYVFEKFRSVDSGKSKIIRGTGLGLPICKAIVEQHGGQIGLESVVGIGSVFQFTLPENRAAEVIEEAA